MSQSLKTKRIKRRVIKHGNIKKISVNKNCPKFLIGHCWMAYRDHIFKHSQPNEASYLSEAFEIVQRWIESGERDKVNRKHLIALFGKTQERHQHLRNYYCAKAFYYCLSEKSVQIMMKNKKVTNMLSYLVCLEKFTARLAHPNLIYKLQFK